MILLLYLILSKWGVNVNQQYCKNCGSMLNPATGQCPKCGNMPYQQHQQGTPRQYPPRPDMPMQPAAAAEKSNKAMVIGLSIAAAAMICAIIVLVIVMVFKFVVHPEDDSVHTSYAMFVNENVVSEVGRYNANEADKKSDGVYSVLIHDLDGEKKEECVVAYKKKNNKQLNYNVACYKISNTGKNATKSDVEPVNEVTSYSEPDYTLDGNKDATYHESRMYAVENDGKVYICEEHLGAYEGFGFELYVYEYTDGKLVEVANLSYSDNYPLGGYCVTSGKLPEGMTVDNSDIDEKELEKKEPMVKERLDNGGSLLYYGTDSDEGFTYTSLYDSATAALDSFYTCFGVTRGEPVITDPYCSVNMDAPEDCISLFHYKYNGNAENGGISVDFVDYTDTDSLLDKADTADEPSESTTKKTDDDSPDTPDFNAVVKQAAKASSDFVMESYIDHDDYVKQDNMQYYRVTLDGVHTFNDFIDYYCQFYTKEAVEEAYAGLQYVEKNNNLYFNAGGTGSYVLNSYGVYSKVSDTQYKFEFYSVGERFCSSDLQYNTYNLLYQDGKWIFDQVLDWEIYNAFTLMSDDDERVTRVKALDRYYKKMEDAYMNESTVSDYDGSYDIMYWLHDIDKDGMPELIYQTGTYEMEYEYHFYTYGEDGIVHLGDESAWHSELDLFDDGNLSIRTGAQGHVTVNTVNIVNNSVKLNTVFDGEYDDPELDNYVYFEAQDEYDQPVKFIQTMME